MKKIASCIGFFVLLSVGLLSAVLIAEQPIAADEECKKPGKSTIISGTLICDCTSTATSDCQCILPPASCQPNND